MGGEAAERERSRASIGTVGDSVRKSGKTEEAIPLKFQFHGYYRARYNWIGNAPLPSTPALPASEWQSKNASYGYMRLRLDPEVTYGPNPDLPIARLRFTTPAGQLHEFGILAGSVLAKEAGFDVLYLGPNLPTEDIIWSVARSKADILVLSVVRAMDEDQMRQMERLVDTVAPHVPVWIGCPPEHPLTARIPKATFISSIEDFQLAAASLLSDDAG